MNNNLNNTKSTVQLQVALIPVCKMVIRFGLHFNEFVRNLQKAYIHAAEDILSNTDIKPNLQSIAIKTGMDRRTISEHKNNNRPFSHPMNKMDMVINQLQLFCAKNQNDEIHSTALHSIIDSIYAQHIRSNAILKELLSNKFIIQKSANIFKLNLTLQQQLVDIKIMADDVDYTAKRLFQTYYTNMFENKTGKPLLQKTTVSTKVPTSKHTRVLELLTKELVKSETKIKEIIKSHESNIPDGTYPELGITQFQFSSLETNTKEN